MKSLAPGTLALLLLAGCSGSVTSTGNDTAASGSSAPSTATTASPLPANAIPTTGRTVAVNVQGSAPVGATVRVKSVELGTDATTLDVSASYGGTDTNDIALAGSATYLLDDQGNRLMLKPPQDNPELRIVKGQTMDGKLVFLGAVPPTAKSIKLVFNDNHPGNGIIDPGLNITIPLGGGER